MNVLFLDFMFPKGHRKFSAMIIRALSYFAKVTVIMQPGYYDELLDECENISMIALKYYKIRNGKISSRFDSIRVMMESYSYIMKLKPDFIFVSSFDTIAFALIYVLYSNTKNMYLIHHNNVDELNNLYKRKIFNIYKDRCNHVVLSRFIKEYLINEVKVDSSNVFDIHHPMEDMESYANSNYKYFCIGLSNSNDESYIEKIIEEEKRTSFFKNNGKKVVFKSKDLRFDNGYLQVINGFLKKDDYDEYMDNCQFVFMPFPETFQYRMSGTLIEALSKGKIVIGTNIPLIKEYSLMYPSMCYVIDNVFDMFKIFESCCSSYDKLNSDFYNFKRDHSQGEIISDFEKMLEKKIC